MPAKNPIHRAESANYPPPLTSLPPNPDNRNLIRRKSHTLGQTSKEYREIDQLNKQERPSRALKTSKSTDTNKPHLSVEVAEKGQRVFAQEVRLGEFFVREHYIGYHHIRFSFRSPSLAFPILPSPSQQSKTNRHRRLHSCLSSVHFHFRPEN